MGKAIDLHHGDVVIAQQLDHPFHKAGYQQRHIATRHIRDVDGIRERCQPGPQSFERPPLLAFVASDR